MGLFPPFLKMATLPFSARTEFTSALSQVCAERGIDPEVVLETIKEAIVAAYRKETHGLEKEIEYEVELDAATGAAKLFAFPKGKKKKKKDVTPPGFGRIATQTAKQVILQKIREAEKEAIIGEYRKRVGTLVNGMVLRFEGKNIICDIGRGQGLMPPEEQIRIEHYHLNQRLALYISEIREETSRGKVIIVSRGSGKLVSELFKREVPEVSSGAVEIRGVAREPGFRSKVAVFSKQKGVDPVGSCVGQKGVRVQAVIKELNGEKIDIIQYSEEPEKFIVAALSPAENLEIKIDKKKKSAQVSAPEDQLSLAIGKEGQNVRLAARLTGYRIDIKGPKKKAAVKKIKAAKKLEIDDLGLSPRVRNALVKTGIEKVKDLKKKKEEELLELKGVGAKAIAEIQKSLKKSEKK